VLKYEVIIYQYLREVDYKYISIIIEASSHRHGTFISCCS